MEKKSVKNLFLFLTLTLIVVFALYNVDTFSNISTGGIIIDRTKEKESNDKMEQKKIYSVYLGDKLLKSFEKLDSALYYADMQQEVHIIKKGNTDWLWDNISKYHIYSEDKFIEKSVKYVDAVKKASNYENGYVYNVNESIIQWSNNAVLKESVIMDVPSISQLPELIRGCEVTSLAMLLKYNGVNVDKMELAEKIDKDNTPYKVENGKMYYGDPSIGFIGSMTNSNKDGYGANHVPITKLLKKYVDEKKVVDLTGLKFENLYYYLSEGLPLWVITNIDLKKLSEREFYKWQTPKGKTIIATNKEHSVLITGYDKEYVYINDPLYNKANRKINKKNFIEAWEQMGSQAVVYIK